jgi:hypothetical protein
MSVLSGEQEGKAWEPSNRRAFFRVSEGTGGEEREREREGEGERERKQSFRIIHVVFTASIPHPTSVKEF